MYKIAGSLQKRFPDYDIQKDFKKNEITVDFKKTLSTADDAESPSRLIDVVVLLFIAENKK
jgi:hypothetical protein